VEDSVAEGDLVAQRIHFEGTHTGEFQGLPPRVVAHKVKGLRGKR
jgi:predicted ester cyclase